MAITLKNDRTKNLARPDFCFTTITHYSVAAVFVESKMKEEIALIHPPYDNVRQVSENGWFGGGTRVYP